MRVSFEHRHRDGRTIRYKVALRRDPWGQSTSETDDMNEIAEIIPWSQEDADDFLQWTTSACIEFEGGHSLPVLKNATVRNANKSKEKGMFSCFLFENTPLMWRDTEWFLNSYMDFSPFISTFRCHVCSSSYVYCNVLSVRILRRCAVAHTGWKRVRDLLLKRSIVLYWHDLTAYQMAEGGTAYVRDRSAFEDRFTVWNE